MLTPGQQHKEQIGQPQQQQELLEGTDAALRLNPALHALAGQQPEALLCQQGQAAPAVLHSSSLKRRRCAADAQALAAAAAEQDADEGTDADRRHAKKAARDPAVAAQQQQQHQAPMQQDQQLAGAFSGLAALLPLAGMHGSAGCWPGVSPPNQSSSTAAASAQGPGPAGLWSSLSTQTGLAPNTSAAAAAVAAAAAGGTIDMRGLEQQDQNTEQQRTVPVAQASADDQLSQQQQLLQQQQQQLLWWWQQRQRQQQPAAALQPRLLLAPGADALASAQQQQLQQEQRQQAAAVQAAAVGDRPLHQQSSRQHRTSRMVWDASLHLRFMEACLVLGVDTVTPKALLQALDEPWLSRENVASHLQKYRLALRKLAGIAPTAQLPGGQALQQLQQEAIRQHKERSAEVRAEGHCLLQGLAALLDPVRDILHHCCFWLGTG